MARFYARFDGASVTALDNDYFDKRQIADASTAATTLRTNLLAAREALSSALKAELNTENEYGSNGPIIPQEIGNISRSGGNLQWNNVYTTSTISGVIIPADFRTRPTGSPTTTDGNLTARSPADSGTISDTLYTDASDALMTTLRSISNNSLVTSSNLGNFPTRSLHSLWHDYDVRYFAWDNFTPGAPALTTPNDMGFSEGGGVYCINCPSCIVGANVKINWSATPNFKNDLNTDGFLDLSWNFVPYNNDGYYYGQLAGSDPGGQIGINPQATGSGPYYHDITVKLIPGCALPPPATCTTGSDGYRVNGTLYITASYRDPIITTSRSVYAYTNLGITDVTGVCNTPGPPPPPPPSPTPPPPPPPSPLP